MTKKTEAEPIVLGVNNLKTSPNGVISVKFLPKNLVPSKKGLQIHSSYLSWESSSETSLNCPKNFQPTPTSLADSESDLEAEAGTTLKKPTMTKPSFKKFYSELLSLKQFNPNLANSSISFGYFSK